MKALIFVVLKYGFELASLIPAGSAPIGRKINEDDLAEMLVKIDVLSALAFGRKIGCDVINIGTIGRRLDRETEVVS